MKRHYVAHAVCAFIGLCAILMVACSSRTREEITRAEDLAIVAPDSAFAILEDIRSVALEDVNTKQEYDLAWAETYYLKHRTLTDSIDRNLTRCRTTAGTRQDITKHILHAIYLYGKGRNEESFNLLDSCRREMDDDSMPYWRCVVEDYAGIICLSAGLTDKAREHFYNVLHYAQKLNIMAATANAYSHLSYFYHSTEQYDSALYYASKVLEHKEPLDSQMMAIAYHNLYAIQMSMKEFRESGASNILRYDSHCIGTEDTMMSHALKVQANLLLGRPEAALTCQHRVERSNHHNAKLFMYKALADYHHGQGQSDSAYKYLRLYNIEDSLYVRSHAASPLLQTQHQHDQSFLERWYAWRFVWLSLLSLAIILGTGFLLRLRQRKRMSTVQDEMTRKCIELENLDKEKTALDDELKNAQEELAHTTDLLSKSTRQLEDYKSLMGKKNTMLARTQRKCKKLESNNKAYGTLVLQDFLDRTSSKRENLDRNQRQYIITSYQSADEERGHFLRTLMREAGGLTTTGIIICILYHEGFLDADIISKLNYDASNFRTAKSRARKAIAVSSNAESPFIRSLLRCFDYKKSGGEA